VLVVDDDPDMATTCAEILTVHGYRCLTASTGAEAIAIIDAEQPDLVVADLHMAGVDGLAVARHASERAAPIPVVLVTAWPGARGEGSSPQAPGRLAKPFANADLVATVRRGLRDRPRPPREGEVPPAPGDPDTTPRSDAGAIG
jgi:DNA-binding response OmpR family regulator